MLQSLIDTQYKSPLQQTVILQQFNITETIAHWFDQSLVFCLYFFIVQLFLIRHISVVAFALLTQQPLVQVSALFWHGKVNGT